jgi:ribonucleotide reductase alpha subunit
VPEAPDRHHEGLRELRGRQRRLLRPGQEPSAQARDQGGQEDDGAGNYVKRVIQFARQGYTDIEFPTYDTDWDSEAYLTVSGQNSNNSVAITDDFLRAVEQDGDLGPDRAQGRQGDAKTLKARDLWEQIGHAAWASADPGLQFHTTINDWHTCPAAGPIRASNPCSEYMFLDDTACNLASLNLLQLPTRTPSVRHRQLRACRPAVDHRAGNLGADGAVPVQARSPNCPTSTARWASATPISAAC